MSTTLLEQFDRTPVSWLVLLAYATLAVLTDPLDPTSAQLVAHGAATGLLVQDGEAWRLLTYAFLHGGLLHLLFNGYFMFVLGPALEQQVGSLRFALIYAVGALGGGVGGCLMHHPIAPLVGGSGALFGMLGAALAMNMRRGRHLLEFLSYQGPRTLLVLIVVNLVLGMIVPMISNAAHVGGLLAGFVLMFMFLERPRQGIDRTGRLLRGAWLTLFASLTFYVLCPVARSDYHLRRFYEARDPDVRRAYAPLATPLLADVAMLEKSPGLEWFAARVAAWQQR